MKLGWHSILEDDDDDLVVRSLRGVRHYTGWTIREQNGSFVLMWNHSPWGCEPFATREEARAFAEVCYRLGVHRGA